MENNDISVLTDFDIFFYYGQNDLSTEIKSDVYSNLVQAKRTLFYNRSSDSCGIADYENMPNTIFLAILLPYEVTASLSKRNSYVTNGEGIYPDRRIVLSQSTVKVTQKGQETDLLVEYINMFDYSKTEKTSLSLNRAR